MPVPHEPTLVDVARAAGVSVTTVSRVLNDRGYLSQETRRRVAQAIAELNYRPNQVARALHGKSTQSIGLIVPTVGLPFFGELVEHVEDALAEHGYRILVCNSMGKAERERDYLDLLVSHRVDGIISGAHNENISEYSTVHLPLVTVDRDLSPTIPNVRCDNEKGGRLATQHLLDRGARHPALLTSRAGTHNLREAGYRTVLAEARIEPVILTVDFHTPEHLRPKLIAERLNTMAPSVDSVFATDDLSAASVLEWALARGLDVPEDFKVIGFDGTAALHRALPGLSTIRQPIQELAHDAVAILLEQIDAGAARQAASSATNPPPLGIELIEGRTT
ncbi:LacI family DNA-binding transcriptional regulator [Actinomyces capricornis]|uniref:LacI family transcriptional regulator n=1 Tax=Actinomyces capricornis TaxID=2755559 RepID=A0ABM7UEU6_9ACTO|nr:LacI family DNA-binding transcriptional regulator [Actinomyces capricornis]BDA65693.1 LacI family transcriptional regulator [Actinomyces capricornis]